MAATDPVAARGMAREAVGLADQTLALMLRADTRKNLGELLESLGEQEAANTAFREAIELYERKGAVVAVEAMRSRFDDAVAAG
jgi:tetratricopeptide (TPR) repeat protein